MRHVNDFWFGAAVMCEASVVPGGLLDAVGFEMQQSESVLHLSYGLITRAGMKLGLFLLKQIPSSLHASILLLCSYKKLTAVKKTI